MKRIRILLADDHPVVRRGFQMILAEQSDMEIVGEAGNGREALELAAKLKPDVVVMDVAMPELNGIEARFESNFDGRLPGETETHLFRIAQEALTNVARHAAARRVTVQLTAEKGQLRLSVEDDGKGLAGAPAEGRGMGMIGMRARARIAGGELTERSRPGQGVLIEVRLPIPHETDSHSAG